MPCPAPTLVRYFGNAILVRDTQLFEWFSQVLWEGRLDGYAFFVSILDCECKRVQCHSMQIESFPEVSVDVAFAVENISNNRMTEVF